jgi:hypothetical protein
MTLIIRGRGLVKQIILFLTQAIPMHIQRTSFSFVVLLLSSLLFLSFSPEESSRIKQIILIDSASAPRSEKEALLILPGFGSKMEGIKDIGRYFAHKGYDLYIPQYIGRDSLGQCVASLDKFIAEQKLGEYKKLHVFSYIIGSWTLNRWIRQHPVNNIATIVYDRSPLQERAPYALVKDMPFFTWLLEGDIVEEFSNTPYEPVVNDAKNIGIIMESRATKLIRKHKASALAPGGPDWSIAGRNQDCDDYFYTLNNHDEMYHDFGEIGPEILYFLRNGKFTEKAPRTKPSLDPFTKTRPKQ